MSQNRIEGNPQADRERRSLLELPRICLSSRELCDFELMAVGALPFSGFMTEEEYKSVINQMRLPNGDIFPVPIVLSVNENTANQAINNGSLILTDKEGIPCGILDVFSIWEPNKKEEAELVFGTTDPNHPGVAYLYDSPPYYVGGPIRFISSPSHYRFQDLRLTPEQVIEWKKENNLDALVAFQTRNPIHRAHFEATLHALRQVANEYPNVGLLIHPTVGETKSDDVPQEARVAAYRRIMPYYENMGVKALLAVVPKAMRYAGPREAIFDMIIRKNYGATHFIIGRDHAGCRNPSNGVSFYDPYEAQRLALSLSSEIGINVVPLEEMVYDMETRRYYPISSLPQGSNPQSISGTQLRRMLEQGEKPPEWFTFHEVAEVLFFNYRNNNIDVQKIIRGIDDYLINGGNINDLINNFLNRGASLEEVTRVARAMVIFLTGLSGAGKSTIAKALEAGLLERRFNNLDPRQVIWLDGDMIREEFKQKLPFTREGRETNILRVGLVAAEVARRGGIAIVSLMAPYRNPRDIIRKITSDIGASFIEVHVATPIEVCEQRDPKHLYQKARQGLISHLSGVDEPYEEPENPEIRIDTTNITPQEAVKEILFYLEKSGLIS